MADVNLSIDLRMEIKEKVTHRVRKFGFGDGYEQIAADGIQSRVTEYDVTTRPLLAADANTLQTNLDNVALGDYFLATLLPFSTTPRRYRLKDNNYDHQVLPGSIVSYEVFEFTLIEAFAS